jgi:hypothetical protein
MIGLFIGIIVGVAIMFAMVIAFQGEDRPDDPWGW